MIDQRVIAGLDRFIATALESRCRDCADADTCPFAFGPYAEQCADDLQAAADAREHRETQAAASRGLA